MTYFNPTNSYSQAEYESALVQACHDINNKLSANKLINTWYSGSTGIIVLLHDRNIVCANVGDSRAGVVAIAADGSSNLLMLSEDHTPNLEAEKERVIQAGGKVMPCQGRFDLTLRSNG